MKYEVAFKPKALRDLESLSPEVARRIIDKIDTMRDGLVGDIKRLMSHTREYRLRVGDYRVLFEIEANSIVIYRVRHRREAYNR